MAQDLSVPDPGIVLELLAAFRRTKAMFAAVSLGVFDALSDGPVALDALATRLKANPDALERLLDACVGMRLLDRVEGHYRNTLVAATYLVSSSPRRLTGYINFSNEIMWRLWSHLEDAVREGSHRWQQTFGWDEPIFKNFFRTEEAAREFLWGMHGFGLFSSPHVVSAVDLRPFTHLVDLGGATGHLVVAACERYPHLRGTVFDLPDAMGLAEEYLATTDVRDRVALVAGDFFTDPLPRGDCYALSRIVHDWSPEKIVRLLTRVVEHLPEGGGVLIAEKLLDDDKRGPTWAQMQNLNMLACTEGKERTLAEYAAILEPLGFREIVACRTSGAVDAILARKRSG